MLFFILEKILYFVTLILPLLLAIAFFTLFERQILGALQRRQGPNIVGFFGILQPITDGVKLLLKESVLPRSANTLIFILAPILTFGLAMAG
jgi:NADH-quinone oxidoreductase subunit H